MVHPTLLSPGDLRTVQSFGPMTFAPGDCKNITTAVVTTFNSAYPNPCFDNIRTSIDSVKSLYQTFATNNLSCQSTTSLNEKGNNTDISIYPNPAHENVMLKFSTSTKGSIIVYTIDGSEVLKGNINGFNTSVDLNNISKGLYFIAVIDQQGQIIANKKIVKE
jgi:hypothetical protein